MMEPDQLAGINTDDLVKRKGKWQFRDDGRAEPKDECGPQTEEEVEDFFDLEDAKEWLPPGYRWVGE